MKFPLLKLWLLLIVAWAAFRMLSTFDSLTVFGHQIAKLDGWGEAVATELPPLPPAKPANSARPAVKTVKDTLPKTILFIGDSMLEGLSPRLAAYAEKNGHRLYTVIWYGSSTKKWGESHRITSYKKRFKPDYVIVCIGGNELFIRNIVRDRAKYVDTMISEIGDIPNVWIVSAELKDDTGINRLLQEKVGDGRFFLSRNLKFDRAKDGAHPTREASAKWMDTIASWIENTSKFPIKMSRPAKATSRATRTLVLTPND